jgi:hypothetical protein
LPNNADRFGASIGNAQYKGEKKTWILWQRFAYSVGHCLFILLYCESVAETEIDQIKDDSKI